MSAVMQETRKNARFALLNLGLGVALAFGFSLVFAPRASADSFQFNCVSPTTCTAGTTWVTSAPMPTFQIVNTNANQLSGTAFVVLALPGSGSLLSPTLTYNNTTTISREEAVNFTSGSLWTALNETGSFQDTNLSTFQSASQQVGVNPAGYTLLEYNLGAWSGMNGGGSLTVTGWGGNLPAGSVIYGFLEQGSSVVDQVPLSHAITDGVVPEPSSLALLGTGAVGLLGFVGRRKGARKVKETEPDGQ